MMPVLRFWKEALIAALLLTAVGMCHARDNALKAKGAAEERIKRADSVLVVLRQQKARIDTQFIHDTLRFTKWKDSVRTMTVSVDKWKHDTLEVVRYVERTDSVITSCADAIHSCELRVRNLEDQLVQERSKQPALTVVSKRSCLPSNVVSGALGALGGVLVGRKGK